MLTILGFLAGTALAARFNVFVLLPGMAVAWLLVFMHGIASANSGMGIAVEVGLMTVSLQLGYGAGIVLQWALSEAGRRRDRAERSRMLPHGTF